MGLLFDEGLTNGNDHNRFYPEGIADWTEFYASVGSPKSDTFVPSDTDKVGKFPTLDNVKDFLNKPLARGIRDVVLPNGNTIAASGSAALDFMRGIVGVGPLDSTATDTKGTPVAAGTGSAFDLSGTFVQIALVAIGAVIIFVALWMLLSSPDKSS